MPKRMPRLLRTVVGCALAMSAVVACATESASPAIPTLLRAHVRDLPDIGSDGDYIVIAELEFADEPTCRGDDFVAYGLFVDADPLADPPTGEVGDAMEGLGADFRFTAECEDGELTSPAGPVVVRRDTETRNWILELHANGRQLPLRFSWVAFAQHDDRVLRVPEPPAVVSFEPQEVNR